MMKKLKEKEWRPEVIGDLFVVSGSITTKPDAAGILCLVCLSVLTEGQFYF